MIRCLFAVLFLSAVLSAAAQDVQPLKLADLEKRISAESDTLYVVNFWATWCKPCIEELPHFEKLGREYAGRKLKVLLVSLDFRSQLISKVIPFVQKKKLQSSVYLLDEKNPNAWIDRVSKDWSGAIPATLFISKGRGVNSFFENEFSYEQLSELSEKFLLPQSPGVQK